jgi:hypothetical protein
VNTSGAAHPDALGSARDRLASEERPSRRREDEDLLAAIAAALQGPAPTPIPATEATNPAERWRATGGALTGPSAYTDAAKAASVFIDGPANSASGTESRLVARIDTPQMGSVCVVVDRSAAGIKVSLAVDDAATAQHAQAERAALVQALESVGLTVASVSVTRIGDGGITFAQVRDAHEAQSLGASDDGEAAEGKPEGRARRRLNLVG